MVNEAVIRIRDLNFFYPDGTRGLESIHMQVERNECLGIIGPNGAGKSTLLKHLNGVFRGEGEVKVTGLPVTRGNLKALRARVGMVFQNPDHQLFMPTLLDDVMFGPLNFGMAVHQALERAEAVLREMGLWDMHDRSPLHLSLGEKKKAALATVLVMEPEVVVLDEPMVSLDPGSRRRMLERIRALEATRIIATHDLELVAEICGKVLLMSHGRIVESGTVEQILIREDLLLRHDLEVPASLRKRIH